MHIVITMAIFIAIGVVMLRGGKLHEYLVLAAETVVRQAGYRTHQEHPQHMPDGRLDFIDLAVERDGCIICGIEAETSARNVLANAQKAEQIGLPLVIIVPNKKVQRAVRNKLRQSAISPGGEPICILLLSQLHKQLANYLPLFSSANVGRKNRKTNRM